VHLIPKVEGLDYAKRIWGMIPLRKVR